jgi:acyl-CoA dehydrogenase
VLYVAETLGEFETNFPKTDEGNLRFITPLVKLFTAKEAMKYVSEGLECFGGVGYMENSGIPGLLRDTQVYSIWEGTTNVLSLEFFKVVKKNPELVSEFSQKFMKIIQASNGSDSMKKIL